MKKLYRHLVSVEEVIGNTIHLTMDREVVPLYRRMAEGALAQVVIPWETPIIIESTQETLSEGGRYRSRYIWVGVAPDVYLPLGQVLREQNNNKRREHNGKLSDRG